MAWRDWAAPVAVGLAGGLLLVLVLPKPASDRAGTQDGTGGETDWSRTGWVFLDGPRTAALPSNQTLLYVGPADPSLPQHFWCDPACQAAIHKPLAAGTVALNEVSPRLHVARAVDPQTDCARPPCEPPAAPYVTRNTAGEPLLLVDGHDAARFTLYAFDLEGEVRISNAPDAELARFALDGDFIPFPGATMYVGNGTAPDGIDRPPAAFVPLLERFVPLLEGLPAGGIATVVSTDHPGAWATGPLAVTVRIDEVLAA